MALTAPLEAPVVIVAKSAGSAMPKRTSLPSMLPPGCSSARGLVDAERGDARIAGLLGSDRTTTSSGTNRIGHRREHRPALARVADHPAERVAQRRRDEQDREHLEEVRERRRVLERMRGVGVEEAAAVGAELLDRHLRGDRAHRQRLRLSVVTFSITGLPCGVLDRVAVRHRSSAAGRSSAAAASRPCTPEVLHHALADEQQREHDRQRQQDVERDAREVDPEVADRRAPCGARSRGSARPPPRCRSRRTRSSAPRARPSASDSSWSTRRA